MTKMILWDPNFGIRMTSFVCGNVDDSISHEGRFSDSLVENDEGDFYGLYFCVCLHGAEMKWPVNSCSSHEIDALIEHVKSGTKSLHGKGVCEISVATDHDTTVCMYVGTSSAVDILPRLRIDVAGSDVSLEVDLDAPAKRSLLHALAYLKKASEADDS